MSLAHNYVFVYSKNKLLDPKFVAKNIILKDQFLLNKRIFSRKIK